MEKFLANIETVKKDDSGNSFAKLLEHKPDKVVRDSFVLLSKENTGTENLTVGYTVVYPGSRTGGHAHPEVEEVYHITKGKGRMLIDDTEFEVTAGDTFWVRPGAFHTTFNTGADPLEYLWILSKWEDKLT